jgi:hypothetical protein
VVGSETLVVVAQPSGLGGVTMVALPDKVKRAAVPLVRVFSSARIGVTFAGHGWPNPRYTSSNNVVSFKGSLVVAIHAVLAGRAWPVQYSLIVVTDV